MLCVLRKKEKALDEIGINGMGFSGSILLKSKA